MALQQRIDGLTELLGFEDGYHLVYYDGLDDLAVKLDYWLHPDRDAERRKIARQGQLFTLKMHSFDARVKELMTWLYNGKPESGADPTLASFHEVRYA